MKNKYINMMEQLTISNEGRAKFICALEGTTAKKSYLPHITAAAVFLGIAAALLLSKVSIPQSVSAKDEPEHPIVINEYCSQEISSYDIVAELRQYNLSEFSDALQSDIASGKVERSFNTREELEAYLGIPLISSPELEAAETVPDLAEAYEYNFEIIRPQYEFAPEARYVVTGINVVGELSAQPEIIKVSIHRIVRNTECYIDAIILTEYAVPNGTTATIKGEVFPALSGIHHESRFDEQGEYQIMSTAYKSALKDFQTAELEMANGRVATIVTATGICPVCLTEKCDGHKEYYGHFISDGVLYSVLPFGIADPTQGFPMQDTDSLSVLKTVLEMFD